MANNNPNYLIIIKQTVDPANPGLPGPVVIAPMPDSLAFDSSSEYETPFAQGLFGKSDVTQLASAAGIRLTTQALTAKIWQGSSENDLSLELDFHAETDPDVEVRQPILTLLKMATASIDTATGMLKAPGPRIDITDTGKILSEGASTLANEASQVASALGSVFGLTKQGTLNSQTANLNGSSAASKPAANGGLGGSQFWKGVIRNQISVQIGNYAFFDSVVIKNVQKTYSHQIDARTGLPMHAKVSIRFAPLFLVTQEDLDQIFRIQGRQ